ncbi:MAG: DUF1697 domain-containing protein [Candidatus Woesebacteria bacterium]
MNTYLILLRGINVGGKNKMPMAQLKLFLEEQGFVNVLTYIQSGNVIVQSKLDAKTVSQQIERSLPKRFKLDSSIIKVLTLTTKQLQAIVDKRPKGFGNQPEKYYSDTIFLMDIDSAQAMSVFDPREGVDKVWPGNGVIYSQRLGSLRTKSRLGKIVGTPMYNSMTIRNWNTTTKLLNILNKIAKEESS